MSDQKAADKSLAVLARYVGRLISYSDRAYEEWVKANVPARPRPTPSPQ